jgi:hypothetical protein
MENKKTSCKICRMFKRFVGPAGFEYYPSIGRAIKLVVGPAGFEPATKRL